RRFPQTIIQQNEPSMRLDAKFRQADGLGPKIETDQASRDSHRAKIFKSQNSNPRQISSSKSQTRKIRPNSRKDQSAISIRNSMDAASPREFAQRHEDREQDRNRARSGKVSR